MRDERKCCETVNDVFFREGVRLGERGQVERFILFRDHIGKGVEEVDALIRKVYPERGNSRFQKR